MQTRVVVVQLFVPLPVFLSSEFYDFCDRPDAFMHSFRSPAFELCDNQSGTRPQSRYPCDGRRPMQCCTSLLPSATAVLDLNEFHSIIRNGEINLHTMLLVHDVRCWTIFADCERKGRININRFANLIRFSHLIWTFYVIE